MTEAGFATAVITDEGWDRNEQGWSEPGRQKLMPMSASRARLARFV
jgi:hypothetical protein